MREVKGREKEKIIPGQELAKWRQEEILKSENDHRRDERWKSWARMSSQTRSQAKVF
jgi:hypothetical protein